MTCIRPAGRRGACSCGNQYAQILDRLDTVEQEASDAKTTAQTAANTASIQAANAAADAAQAASDAGDALTQATAAAASAASAALDAGNAAADLASINSTISSTLTTYLGTKVDKLTTTGSFAYTHTNATQGETALVDGTTSNTIPIRDASGYIKAASPATGVYDTNLANGTKVKNELDNYAPMVRTTGNVDIAGNKRIIGRLIDRVCYIKNTTGATNAVPVFRLSASTKNDRYMKAVMLIGGRTVPTTICEITWNNTTLSKTDIVGTQNNVPSIWEDPDGDYWLCFTIGSNNAISIFELMCLRNAGFDEPMYAYFSSNAPSMTGWSQVVSA